MSRTKKDRALVASHQEYEVAPVVTKFRKLGYNIHAKDVRALAKEFNNSRDDIEKAITERFEKTPADESK